MSVYGVSDYKIQFRVSARVAALLGEQSVSSVTVALSELVKNSYDADATKVKVFFEENQNGDLKIIINDDGHGMTLQDLKDKWMVVGTSDKELHKFSPRGRRKVGEKGIGRFAVQRLGDKMKMISKPFQETDIITLDIDWKKYYIPDATLDGIDNPLHVEKRLDNENHGLKIIVSELKDTWSKQEIENLQQQLGLLVPPFWQEDKFSVMIDAPHIGLASSKVSSGLFHFAAYTLFCSFGDGKIRYEILLGNNKHTSGELSIDLSCGPMKFTLYYFPLGPSGPDQKLKQYVLKDPMLKRHLQEHHGIKIFRDGFRVKPYGDQGDDWLGLNLMRVNNPTMAFSNNQLIGIVEVSRDKNTNIVDTTTREGLIKNDAYYDMRTFLLNAIKILMNQREKDFGQKIPELYESRPMKRIEKAARMISKTATKEDRLMIEHAVGDLKTAAVQIQTQFIDKMNMYYGLSSLGISVAAVAHEIGESIGAILQRTKYILNKIEERPLSQKESKSFWDGTLKDILKIREFISFAAVFTSSEERRKSAVDLSNIVDTVIGAYESVLHDQYIKVEKLVDHNIPPITGFKVDFESIMINLMTNSIEALKEIVTDRKIRITCVGNSNGITIKFSDSGNGIPSENMDLIFEPFITTKKEGTGLGLAIITEILNNYHGKISVTDSEFGKGATFLIYLPIGGLN